jgi:N-acetylmuramoyl-L-alanine amidase
LLNEGATVFMTREKDTTLSMPERIMTLREQQPDFLISLHLNSSDYDTVQGVSTLLPVYWIQATNSIYFKTNAGFGVKRIW